MTYKNEIPFESLKEYLGELEKHYKAIDEAITQTKDIISHLRHADNTRLIGERAYSYWLAHISLALNENSDWVGKSMFTFEETLAELKALAEDVEGQEILQQLEELGVKLDNPENLTLEELRIRLVEAEENDPCLDCKNIISKCSECVSHSAFKEIESL